MNRLDRLVGILLLLHSRKVIRAKDIAEHFEISVRTVYRDIRALEEAGVPLSAEAGEGYALMRGYSVPPVMFSPEEATALFLGGEFAARLTDQSLKKPITTALAKIRAVLPEETKSYIQRLSESTEIFIRAPKEQSVRGDALSTTQDAVVNQYALKIEYLSGYRNEVSFREIEPLGLLFYDERWHLIAYCRLRKGLRDFRLDRIKSLAVLPQVFKRPPDFSLKAYAQNSMRLENPKEVKVRFQKRAADSVRQQNYFGLVEQKESGDGCVELTFLVRSLYWIAAWLLSYGTMVEILAPSELKQMVFEEAQKLIEHHRPT
jgi:predicted DNA-binding transcriptional regulator YafY